MCERRDSIRALGQAADELLQACCQRRTFRGTVNEAITAPLPSDFTEMLGKIDSRDSFRFDPLSSSPVTIRSVQPVVVGFRNSKGRRK